MGTIGVKIKVMPESPEVDMEKLKENVKALVQKKGGRNREYMIEPVAFGLMSLTAFFEWPEEKAMEELEDSIKKIKNVSSTQVLDMRRLI
ncbi:MAG TPA: elongation factor 1-beta [Patescibacteria group bacterium]|nr:elongation factor 1-beta [Patescibacteria group bacterium]